MTTSPAAPPPKQARKPALSLSLADIAALARVQRPVVTTWRSRSRDTAHPFPAPVPASNGDRQERFDVDDVVGWLTATGRGNNPDAVTEAVLHADPIGSAADLRRHADTLTALLTLCAARGEPLTGLSRAELLDAADAEDPDDGCLYREIAALDDDAVAGWADLADRTADAAWNAAAAVERLSTDPGRPLGASRSAVALTVPATDLVAALLTELALSQQQRDTRELPVLVEETPGGSGALLTVLDRVDGAVDPVVRLSCADNDDENDDDGRMLRRRLTAQRRAWLAHRRQDRTAPRLHLAQIVPTTDARAAFSALEDLALDLTDADRALVLGQASLLVDACTAAADTGRRADLLRSGRVRCLVRLPAGLLPGRSREALALWVLGPATSWPDGEDQVTLVADLTGRQLDAVVIGDLASDVAASLAGAHGERGQFAARAFRFGRLVPTRRLTATGGALITSPAAAHQPATPAAGHAVAVERLLSSVGTPLAGLESVVVTVAEGASPSPTATIGALITAGHLRCLPGTRLAVPTDAVSGTRVLDATSLGTGGPSRHVDLFAFTRVHPSARLTEPGDVVFVITSTTAGPAAVVDVDGGAVVAFPARILRIDAADPGGLNPAVLAADINAYDAGERRWQQWRVHRVPDADSAALTATLARVGAAQEAAEQRLADLRQLARTLVSGVTAGSITLNPTPPIERTN